MAAEDVINTGDGVLRYPLSQNNEYKGVVFFQTIRDNATPLQYQFPATDTTGPSIAGAQLFKAKNTPTSNATPKSYGQACVLYLPQAIQIADAATYNNVALGAIGASVEAAMQAGVNTAAGVASAATKAALSNIGSTVDAIRGSLDGGSAAARFAGQRVVDFATKDGSGIQAAVRGQTRVTANPNIRAMFDQVPLREFSFTFKLIANDAAEALEIKKIIKYFRTELYPSDIPIGPEGTIRPSLGYNFPDLFRIEFHHAESSYDQTKWHPEQVATKLKDCYMYSFNTVYNATSMGMHKDGNFTEIDITMSFREAASLTKADVQAGY